MVEVTYEPKFKEQVSKLRDHATKDKVKKQLVKIIANPEIGKPMRYGRKGTRELRVAPFRLCYVWNAKENIIDIIELYHKDKQ